MFEIPLVKGRINGSYPVTLKADYLDVLGQQKQQSFTVYVTVTDGKNPSDPNDVPKQTVEKPERKAIIKRGVKAAEYFSSWTGEPNTAMEFHSVINRDLSPTFALASSSIFASVPLSQRIKSSGRKNILVMVSLKVR